MEILLNYGILFFPADYAELTTIAFASAHVHVTDIAKMKDAKFVRCDVSAAENCWWMMAESF